MARWLVYDHIHKCLLNLVSGMKSLSAYPKFNRLLETMVKTFLRGLVKYVLLPFFSRRHTLNFKGGWFRENYLKNMFNSNKVSN